MAAVEVKTGTITPPSYEGALPPGQDGQDGIA